MSQEILQKALESASRGMSLASDIRWQLTDEERAIVQMAYRQQEILRESLAQVASKPFIVLAKEGE